MKRLPGNRKPFLCAAGIRTIGTTGGSCEPVEWLPRGAGFFTGGPWPFFRRRNRNRALPALDLASASS